MMTWISVQLLNMTHMVLGAIERFGGLVRKQPRKIEKRAMRRGASKKLRNGTVARQKPAILSSEYVQDHRKWCRNSTLI